MTRLLPSNVTTPRPRWSIRGEQPLETPKIPTGLTVTYQDTKGFFGLGFYFVDIQVFMVNFFFLSYVFLMAFFYFPPPEMENKHLTLA